jgi:hypothetical protein
MVEQTSRTHHFAVAATGHHMARTLLTLSIAALLMAPTPALAGDSLLSGYGGPGGGEQVILGAKLLPGGGGGKGGGTGALRASGATPPAISAPLPSGGPASGLEQLAAAPARPAHSAPARHTTQATTPAGSPSPAAPARPLTAQPVRTRTIASGDAGSPLSGGALLLVALAAAALGLTAAGTRRLVTRSGTSGAGAATQA